MWLGHSCQAGQLSCFLPLNLPHDVSPRRACVAVQLFPLSSAAVSYPLIYAQM